MKLERDTIDVPEWQRSVTIRELTAQEKQEYESSLVTFDRKGRPQINSKDVAIRLVVLTVVDEAGTAVFGSEDIPWLRKQSGAAIDRIFTVAKRLSAVDEDELERLKAAKNG